MTSVEFKHTVVKISASNISLEILEEDVHFILGETAAENTQFRVSEIDEENVSRVFG